MSEKDRQKWEEKYRAKSRLLKPREASANIKQFVEPSVGAKALDLACGAGRNAIYLAKLGYAVDALDIAAAALEALRTEAGRAEVSARVNTQLSDLDTFTPAAESYELIVMMNFLDRTLIERAKAGLKSGGLFIVETYMDDERNDKQDSDTANLLQKEELKILFKEGFETLFYEEFENGAHELYRMQKQVIVVKKR